MYHSPEVVGTIRVEIIVLSKDGHEGSLYPGVDTGVARVDWSGSIWVEGLRDCDLGQGSSDQTQESNADLKKPKEISL